jgi:hypothetical protein
MQAISHIGERDRALSKANLSGSVVRTSRIFVTPLPFAFKISPAGVRWRRERTYLRGISAKQLLTKLEISFGFRHELKSNSVSKKTPMNSPPSSSAAPAEKSLSSDGGGRDRQLVEMTIAPSVRAFVREQILNPHNFVGDVEQLSREWGTRCRL